MKGINRYIALFLAGVMALGYEAPVQAAYSYSSNEIMYIKGVKLVSGSKNGSYTLFDVDGDYTDELFYKKGDTLSVFSYSKKKDSAVKRLTVKKVKMVYADAKRKSIFVATKDSGLFSYKLKKGKFTKLKNAKKKTAQKLTFIRNEPWVDSDIVGTAKAVGKNSKKNDFHLASNYSYLKKDHIESEYDVDYFINDLQAVVESNIKNMFNDRDKYPSEKSRGLKICRDYYDFATDWDRRDTNGVEPLRKYVETLKSASTIADIRKIVSDPKKSPFTSFFKYGVDLSGTDNIDWTMSLDIDEFSVNAYTLGGSNLSEQELADQRVQFEEINYSVLGRLGYSKKDIKAILQGCYELEAAIAPSVKTYTNEEIDAALSNYVSYEKLCKTYTAYPMKDMLNGYGVTGGRIAVVQPDYAQALDEYFTQSHVEQIRDYLIAHNVAVAANYLDLESMAVTVGDEVPKNAKDKKAYIKNMNAGIYDEAIDDGIRTHVDMDSSVFSVAIQDAYMDCFVDERTATELSSMVKECKDSFREILTGEEWMSEAGRKTAVEKLDNMEYFVMKPSNVIDPSYLAVDTSKNYLDAMVSFRNSRTGHLCGYVGKKVDRKRWNYDLMPGNGPTKVNAEYLPDLNQFYIYAGIVGDPTFTSDMSIEEKLGRLGNIVGHEMTHGFDPRGSKYDKNGSLVATETSPNGWFSDEDFAAYQKRVAKVKKYYDTVTTLPEITLDGSSLYGEAVADMGGMSITLNIAQKQESFNYKKFFEAYSDMWKRQNSVMAERSNLTADPHPPVYLRVNVTLQQFDKFRDTYGIKKSDGMYLPESKRILVW